MLLNPSKMDPQTTFSKTDQRGESLWPEIILYYTILYYTILYYALLKKNTFLGKPQCVLFFWLDKLLIFFRNVSSKIIGLKFSGLVFWSCCILCFWGMWMLSKFKLLSDHRLPSLSKIGYIGPVKCCILCVLINYTIWILICMHNAVNEIMLSSFSNKA